MEITIVYWGYVGKIARKGKYSRILKGVGKETLNPKPYLYGVVRKPMKKVVQCSASQCLGLGVQHLEV